MPAVVSKPYTAWKLSVNEGRQLWHPYEVDSEEQAARIQTDIDRHWLTKDASNPDSTYENGHSLFETPLDSLRNAIRFFSTLQTEDGHWAGDYGGPLFLLPGFVIMMYITGMLLPEVYRTEIVKYIRNTQNPDGGWALHLEGPSIMFGTVLNYISLRLMGVCKDDDQCQSGRKWILDRGGAVGSSHWGKLYMCVLNVMEWECMDPVPPELWLLPSWFPFVQPGKWWCHVRNVYMPMAYLHAKKQRARLDPLLLSLREELYCEQYTAVKWAKHRNYIHPTDVFKPLHPVYKFASWIFTFYEKIAHLPPFSWLRNRAIAECVDHMKHEDRTTNFICLGPVNKVMNMIGIYFEEGESTHFKKHIDRCHDYLWKSNLGMHFQGYNGSQLWDTAFTTKAIIVSGLQDEFQETVRKGHDFVRLSQVREDVDQYEKYYRSISKGGWPFSTRDHGYPITDCTADGLSLSILVRQCHFIKKEELLPDQNAFDAVNVILAAWNKDTGGWAAYEHTRTSPIIEILNPAALFGDIMIDYTHVECTSSCVQALVTFKEQYPNHRPKEVDMAIAGGVRSLKNSETKEGGWRGFWAVCYCYATWFAVCGLIAAGENKRSPIVRRACQFLVERQHEDGGWGESYHSCLQNKYIQNKRSEIVSTSWALLALMVAEHEDKTVIRRGIELLCRRQMPNGDFPQESISGVFNMNCLIAYSNYRNIFPIWTLAHFVNVYNKPNERP